MNELRVVLAGLGRIGAGNSGLAGSLPLDHFSAVRAAGGYRIAGLVDPDTTQLAAAGDVMPEAVQAGTLSELPETDVDVVVLATPAEGRPEAVRQALALGPRALVVEKPLAATFDDARSIVAATDSADVLFRVNFNRRFDPRFGDWRARRPISPRVVTVRYCRGLYNYASHFVDLLMDWYGPVTTVEAGTSSGTNPDPSLSFRCDMAAGFPAFFVGCDLPGFDLMDMEIIGQDVQLDVRAGGAEVRLLEAVPDLHYRGYTHLRELERDAAPVGGFVEFYRALRDHLASGSPLAGCDGAEALANMAVLSAAADSAAAGGRPFAPTVPFRTAA